MTATDWTPETHGSGLPGPQHHNIFPAPEG